MVEVYKKLRAIETRLFARSKEELILDEINVLFMLNSTISLRHVLMMMMYRF